MTPIHDRLRVESGRCRAGEAWVRPWFVSEFSAIHLARIKREAELVRRLDRAVAAQRNGVRVLAMASNLFDLRPTQPGYEDAVERVLTMCAERGLWVELCAFADAQVVMPSHEDRKAFVTDLAQLAQGRVEVILQVTNEPFKNGFTSATDPTLLELADLVAWVLGHRDFSIGDPVDADAPEDVGPMTAAFQTLAAKSGMLVWHPSRKEDASRWRRWVDHLKGADDIRQTVGGSVVLLLDEPMGAASVSQPGRRDSDPEAHVAAACVAAMLQCGYTYHYISEQDDATPGLMESAIALQVPYGADVRFVNSGTAGAPVESFSGGIDKVRCCVQGPEAWAVAYGQSMGTLHWAPGYQADLVYASPHVELWRAA